MFSLVGNAKLPKRKNNKTKYYINREIVSFRRVFLVFLLISSFLFLSHIFSKNVSAAAFNVYVDDNVTGGRWSSIGSGCGGLQGITLQCVQNCSGEVWRCSQGVHLDVRNATENTIIEVELVQPLPTAPSGTQFTGCTWTFFEFLGGNSTQPHASGSTCTASFTIPGGSSDFQYGVHFQMQAPPPTSAPTLPPPPPSAPIKCTPSGQAANTGVNSAVGCIPYANMTEFTVFFLNLGIGIGGGIAFILMVFGAIQIMTSRGDPQKLATGKQLLAAAISGILLLLFSAFLFRLIGRNILKIPGL